MAIEAIQDVVHIIPRFGKSNEYFVNKYIWSCLIGAEICKFHTFFFNVNLIKFKIEVAINFKNLKTLKNLNFNILKKVI